MDHFKAVDICIQKALCDYAQFTVTLPIPAINSNYGYIPNMTGLSVTVQSLA
jgi:hypothetical protein